MSDQVPEGDVELVPCVEGSMAEMKHLAELCRQADIDTEIATERCAKPGCTPKVQLFVAPNDAPRVAELLRSRWLETLEREGFQPVLTGPIPDDGELPCPACGTAAPLVEGACSDCGLQLE